jgi:hypothetical protein
MQLAHHCGIFIAIATGASTAKLCLSTMPPAAADSRITSRTLTDKPPAKLIPIYRPPRDNRLGGPWICMGRLQVQNHVLDAIKALYCHTRTVTAISLFVFGRLNAA